LNTGVVFLPRVTHGPKSFVIDGPLMLRISVAIRLTRRISPRCALNDENVAV
jgi:hypothetical protein